MARKGGLAEVLRAHRGLVVLGQTGWRTAILESDGVVVDERMDVTVSWMASGALVALLTHVEREADRISDLERFVLDACSNGFDVTGTFMTENCWEVDQWQRARLKNDVL